MRNKIWRCPRCGRTTKGYGATSRRDNETKICSDCGTAEALFDWKVATAKQEGMRVPQSEIQEERTWLQEVSKNERQIC
jgi:ribosomal protein L37AE/L43A